jgi:hypothetical protein
MKKNNPNTPIMLREAAGTPARVYARYGEFPIFYAGWMTIATWRSEALVLNRRMSRIAFANTINHRVRKREERRIIRLIRQRD